MFLGPPCSDTNAFQKGITVSQVKFECHNQDAIFYCGKYQMILKRCDIFGGADIIPGLSLKQIMSHYQFQGMGGRGTIPQI